MKRIVIYARGHVTREEQVRMEDFAASIPGAVVTKVYWDHDGSERAQFRSMLAAVRTSEVDAIIAQSICRFSPDANECIRLLRDFHGRGVRIWFAKERTWSTEFTQRFRLAV